MKKTLFVSLLLLVSGGIFAQNEKLSKAIEAKLITIDTSQSVTELIEIANYFERISKAEPKEWLPFYYKAYSHIKIGNVYNLSGKPDLIDAQADEAEKYLDMLDKIAKPNSETYCLRKMVATLRIVADPMNRYPTFNPIAEEAMDMAQSLNPENPRIYLMKGLDKYFTPEQFGGSKTEAKELLGIAIAKFKAFKPETPVSPQWGLGQAQYFFSLIK